MPRMDRVGTHATTVKTSPDGSGRVTYHETDVVVWDRDSITLDTGGWFTVTTKTRMNQASNVYGLRYQVYQEKGQWYVWFPCDAREKIAFDGNRFVTFKREG